MKEYTTKVRLRLRSSAALTDNNILTVLPQNTLLQNNDEPESGIFTPVIVPYLNKQKGWVATEFIEAHNQNNIPPITEPVLQVDKLPPVHLNVPAGTSVKRADTNFRWLPLTEDGMPQRTNESALLTKNDIETIIQWLDVEKSLRYQPTESATFCNIYAYDFCRCAGVYLPHIFWNSAAIIKIKNGEIVKPQLGSTTFELNANSLYNWFKEFSTGFGWARTYDLSEFQSIINSGAIGVIIGQRIDLNRSGHITVCVPENNLHTALRQDQMVIAPLQSQAGAVNRAYTAKQWWNNADKFRAFGFWYHK